MLVVGAAIAVTGHPRPPAYTPVTVEAGDSLWSIAARQDPNADPRSTVERIMARNGLHSALIVPGQRLEVPTR